MRERLPSCRFLHLPDFHSMTSHEEQPELGHQTCRVLPREPSDVRSSLTRGEARLTRGHRPPVRGGPLPDGSHRAASVVAGWLWIRGGGQRQPERWALVKKLALGFASVHARVSPLECSSGLDYRFPCRPPNIRDCREPCHHSPFHTRPAGCRSSRPRMNLAGTIADADNGAYVCEASC